MRQARIDMMAVYLQAMSYVRDGAKYCREKGLVSCYTGTECRCLL